VSRAHPAALINSSPARHKVCKVLKLAEVFGFDLAEILKTLSSVKED